MFIVLYRFFYINNEEIENIQKGKNNYEYKSKAVH